MMWGYGNYGAGFAGFWILGVVFYLVAFFDLVLLGTWLWKQLKKK